MNDIPDEDLKAVIESMGRALRLPISDESYPVVAAHLRVAFKMAEGLDAFPLPEEAEPATVFSA